MVGSYDCELIRTEIEKIEQQFLLLLEKINNLKLKWGLELDTKAKALIELESGKWKASDYDDGEYISTKLAPNLYLLLKDRGKLQLANYSLYLSKNQKWIKRYRRGDSRGAASTSMA